MKIDFDGEDMHFSMDMDMGAAKTAMDYTLVDGVLYLKGVVNAYGQTQTIKSKAALNDEQYKEFTSEMDYSLDLDPNDFASVSVEQNGDTYVVSCLGFTEKLNEVMDEIASGITETFEGDVEITEASYVVEIKDGKADNAALFCAYKISVNGETVEFSLSLDLKYDYSNPAPVTAPSDADSYTTVDYSQIAG